MINSNVGFALKINYHGDISESFFFWITASLDSDRNLTVSSWPAKFSSSGKNLECHRFTFLFLKLKEENRISTVAAGIYQDDANLQFLSEYVYIVHLGMFPAFQN